MSGILNMLIRKIFCLLFIIVLQSCYQKEINKGKENPFSISLGSFKTYEKAFQFKSRLDTVVRANLRLEYVSKKNYKLLYGKFHNSLSAGEKAYELYCDTLINDYDITRNGIKVLDEFINVPFIGNFLGKPSLYTYNIKNKNTELLWSQKDGKVISLNLSEAADHAFFSTAASAGQFGGLPFIKNVNLFLLHRIEDNIDQIDELGDGYQFYTYWNAPDSFYVNISFSDSNNPRIIYQRIQSYDLQGKRKSSSERSFDIIKQGFPVAPSRKPQLTSPNLNCQLRIVHNNDQSIFYLKNFLDKSEILISSINEKIKDIRWSSDGNYFFIVSEFKVRISKRIYESRNHIFIIDAANKKVKKILEGNRFENLLVRGKLVFFDELFNGTKRIVIYDYVNRKHFDYIELPGGCGLNTLNGN